MVLGNKEDVEEGGLIGGERGERGRGGGGGEAPVISTTMFEAIVGEEGGKVIGREEYGCST